MLAKINSAQATIFVLALAVLLSGCTPAGPRAFLKGKKYLDRGDAADAVTQFRRATSLLATNAAAWNYLGVALQESGQLDEAVNAYRNALGFDHELAEAHFNLGLLYFDQNKFDAAKTELTAYTLRRPNDPTAWLKLGFAQLRGGGDTLPAKRSFSTVLSLKPYDAEAYNGLGLASLQSGSSRDAESFFAAAVKSRPDFASALQNLATVDLQYLHDTKAAIANYEAYLALTPRPANYNEVRDLVANLARSEATPTATAPPAATRTPAPAPSAETRPRANNPTATTPRPPPVNRPEPEQTYASRPSQRPTVIPAPQPPPETVASVPTQTVQVRPEPEIVTTPKPYRPAAAPAPVTNVATTQEPLEAPMPDQSRQGFWHRYFGSSKPSNATPTRPENTEGDVTPPPGTGQVVAGAQPQEQPAEPQPVVQPITTFNRYRYKSPAKPAAGDRRSADGAFTKASMAEQDENWVDAEQWYQSAADFDPSWFQAQYNSAIIAQRLGNYSVALPRYEMALAIQPESVDARYNFALALKAMGYALDAAAELKKILAAHPDEVRAHLALANLYAQTIHDIPQARHHYLRVLALQPDNPHSAEIRFWLSANSK